MKRLKVGVGITAMAVLAAACGSDSSNVTAGDYARGVCTAIGEWSDATEMQALALVAAFDSDDPAQAKAGFIAVLEGVVTETDKANDRIDESGVPDIDDGKALARDLNAAFEEIAAAVKTARSGADDLGLTTMQDLIADASVLIENYRSRVTNALGVLDQLEVNYPSDELRQAISQEPACVAVARA